MRSRSFETIATIKIRDKAGKEIIASAQLHQDPQFLHANRIALIGPRAKEIELLPLEDGLVTWELHRRPDWKLSDDPTYSNTTSGTGYVRSHGMTRGVAIADDTIQPFADIPILELTERLRGKGPETLFAEYWFLQRPRGWHVQQRNWRVPDPPRLAGPWTMIRSAGVRFRLLRITHVRDDERLSQEEERIELPGIEIRPIGTCKDEAAFLETADRVWFAMRVLLTFQFRQFVYPLAEFKERSGAHDRTWHTVRLKPRERFDEPVDPPIFGRTEIYLAKAGSALLALYDHQELMHAAAFGYATSFMAVVNESGLTSCVEAIERLVEAFEQVNGLTSERIDKRRWRALGKAVRREAAPLAKSNAEREAIERALSEIPRLRLLERIERMVKCLRPRKYKLPPELLAGAAGMIKARNDIVHGRMVKDPAALRIELVRAQLLFERLWLGFLHCGHLTGSGWPLYSLRAHDAERARSQATGAAE